MPSDPPEETDPSYQDVLDTRANEEFILFAQLWIEAQRTGDYASEYHMNLLFWSTNYPVQVLAVILNLLDFSEKEDDMLQEMIAMGPVEWLIEHCPESFAPILRDAVRDHPRFALFTEWKREHSDKPAWTRLKDPQREEK